jgi:hypothetical protein
MSVAQLRRIDQYRNTLRLSREAPECDTRPHPPSGDGSGVADPRGDESGQEGTRQSSREGGTTRGVSNTGSVRTWANVVSGGRGNVVPREDLADVMTPDGTLIAEGVDDDADGEDCTWKDELMLLAYNDPTWIPVLQNYLKEEREETEKLQGERMERVITWLQATPSALTA